MRIMAILIGAVCLGGVALIGCLGSRMLPSTGEGAAMQALIKQMLYERAAKQLAATTQIAGGADIVMFVDYGDDRDRHWRDGVDPPQTVLDALSGLGQPAKGVSRVRWDEQGFASDPETGDPGWVVHVTIVQWLCCNSVEVEYSATHGPEAAWGVRGVVRWVAAGATEDNNGGVITDLRECPGGEDGCLRRGGAETFSIGSVERD